MSRALIAVEVVALAWAIGLATFTALAFVLYLAGVRYPEAVWPALALALVIVGVAGLFLGRSRARHLGPSGGLLPWIMGAGIVALPTTYAFWLAFSAPIYGWDGWAIWALKARMIDAGGPPLSYFHDPVTQFSHPGYPLNLPFAEAALFQVPGQWGTDLSALVGPICLMALLLLFAVGLNRLYGTTTALLGTLALGSVPAFLPQAASGFADVPLTMYVGASALYLLLWWKLRRTADALVFGLLCGAAIWTKREGLVLVALLLLAYLYAEFTRRPLRWRTALPVLASAALPLPWLAFLLVVHPIEGDFLPLTWRVFVTNIGRLPTILSGILHEMLSLDYWSTLWVMIVIVVLTHTRMTSMAWRLLLLLGVQIGVYAFFYVFSSWNPYTAHITASISRLLLQVVPLTVLLLIEVSSHSRSLIGTRALL